MNGPAITKQIRQYLELLGWVVLVANSNRPMPQGMKGCPDLFCFHEDVCLLVEVKGGGDRLRDDQREFAKSIQPCVGPHLRYIVAHGLDEVIALIEGG